MPVSMRLFLILLCLWAVFAAPRAAADASDGAPHTLNLKDADINVLIATVSEITGKTFIVDPRVQGKVNVVSNQPLSKAQLYELFLSILRVNGFSAIASGSTVRIVPEQTAASDGGVGLGSGLGDEMITRIVELRHVTPGEMVQVLNPLKSPSAQILAHNGSSSLVIADRASNVARMLEIIRRIDQASQADIEVVSLGHASSTEIVRTINQLAGGADANNKVVSDERTNSVLLSGDRARRIKLRALIATLDVPLPGSDTLEVVYLRYAKAEELVPILEGVLRGSSSSDGAPLAGVPGSPGGPSAGRKETVIQAHKETNALIITAAPAVLRGLRDVIRKLDIRSAQVLIEAVIAEVSEETAKQLGVQWQGTDNDFNDRGLIGGTNFPTPGPGIIGTQAGLANPQTGLGALAGAAGLNLGYILGSIKLPGSDTEIIQLGALATALASDGNGNVLSQPSTIALDHQKASLSVGQEVPFKTGSFANTSAGGGSPGVVNPFQTNERKDVGLKLVVTPHINEGDSVMMEIELEVSSLAANVVGATDLITNKRTLSTRAMVRDGGMLVLGGLMTNEAREAESRVPGLGRIPILGELFKSRSTNTTRRNLLIFIRPRIMRDAFAEDVISSEKYNYLRAEQMRANERRNFLTPPEHMPILPELKDFLKDGPPAQTAPARELN